jgi:hypothetical protein
MASGDPTWDGTRRQPSQQPLRRLAEEMLTGEERVGDHHLAVAGGGEAFIEGQQVVQMGDAASPVAEHNDRRLDRCAGDAAAVGPPLSHPLGRCQSGREGGGHRPPAVGPVHREAILLKAPGPQPRAY